MDWSPNAFPSFTLAASASAAAATVFGSATAAGLKEMKFLVAKTKTSQYHPDGGNW